MKTTPKAFLSYSHADKELATKLANTLRASGVDVWFDKWDILPGDSLIQKIFEEGLANADVFMVLVSKNSVNSRWVRQELDVALVKRIEGITRVIPVVVDGVNPPEHLRTLRWVDLSRDFDTAVRELQGAIYQVHERPPLGRAPEFMRQQLSSVGGLSRVGTTIGLLLIRTGKDEIGNEEHFTPKDIQERLGLSVEEVNDGIDELESHGLVETVNYLGTFPYNHAQVSPTYALFLHFRGHGLAYDPEGDIKAVAAAVAGKKEIDGPGVAEATGLSSLRINRAMNYLKDYGIVEIIQCLGSAPFDFTRAGATGATRRFVSEHCK